MRNSVIILLITGIYIYIGCGGSDTDKYTLITKNDRKAIKEICNCMEPLSEYIDKMATEKDSIKARMNLDSFNIKVIELAPCFEKAEKYEKQFSKKDDEYIMQMIEYIKEKYPKCLPAIFGNEHTDSTKSK
jgi:hypothetical protein